MSDHATVEVEWALWGKAETDVEYNLLACSGGLDPDIFVEQINRYSPGTAQSWPQATVNGFTGPDGVAWAGMAVHDTAEGRYDASGREIVFTRYFCAPFSTLAAAQVGYGQLYDGCAYFWPIEGRSPYQFTITKRPARDETHDELGAYVAAWRLTGHPVCVLGAHDADARCRVAFLDKVMSFLPFGMRSALAGATWASGTAYDLNFRLFFADQRRAANDRVVEWNGARQEPIRYQQSEQYLDWLHSTPGVTALLARSRTPTGFGTYEIADLLDKLGVSHAAPVFTPAAPSRAAPGVAAPGVAAPGVAGILRECGRRIRGANPEFIDTELRKLRACRSQRPDPAWRDIVVEEGLLRPLPKLRKRQAELYRAVVQVVFGTPLSYEAFVALAEAAGSGGSGGSGGAAPLHRGLAESLEPGWLADERVRLLVARSISERELKRLCGELSSSPAALAKIITATDTQPGHSAWLASLALNALLECTDLTALQHAVHPHAYLAPALDRVFPGDVESQTGWLREILKGMYGDSMDRPTVVAVLDDLSHPATTALFGAVLILTPHATLAATAFARSTLRHAGYDPGTRDRLLGLLPAREATSSSDVAAPASPAPRGGVRGKLHLTPHPRRQSRPLYPVGPFSTALATSHPRHARHPHLGPPPAPPARGPAPRPARAPARPHLWPACRRPRPPPATADRAPGPWAAPRPARRRPRPPRGSPRAPSPRRAPAPRARAVRPRRAPAPCTRAPPDISEMSGGERGGRSLTPGLVNSVSVFVPVCPPLDLTFPV
jgi:hypothetical protein